MVPPAGVGAAVAGAAVVTLLSAALALYGPPLDAGTWPRAASRTRGAGGRRGAEWCPRPRCGGAGGGGGESFQGSGAFRPDVVRVIVEFGFLFLGTVGPNALRRTEGFLS